MGERRKFRRRCSVCAVEKEQIYILLAARHGKLWEKAKKEQNNILVNILALFR